VGVEKENTVTRLLAADSAFGSPRYQRSPRPAGKRSDISTAAAAAPTSAGRANFGRRILTVERWTPRERLRIPVATVVGMVAEGMTTPEILEAYPDLVEDDVREALQFAAAAVRERDLPLASTL
jgi:hypothetical protein